MSSRLFYLLSSLPPLPGFGEPLPCSLENVLTAMRTEEDPTLDLLADCFAVEPALRAMQKSRLVGHAAEPPVELMELLPSAVRERVALWPSVEDEVAWHEDVCFAWFRHMHQTGLRVCSRLLQRWSAWEMTLAVHLANARDTAESAPDRARPLPPDAPAYDYAALITEWSNAADPMTGEHKLDEARFAFLAAESTRYSFELDELVFYLLKLRLLSRYAALDRGAALKILEEVTAL
ncbi:MAG TPA: hypothetical protein VIV61_19500 [Candidatus Ozemobacteraceae bacterium]